MNPHLWIIHFPIAFVLLAAVLDIAGLALKDRSMRDWSWRILLMGALAGFLAFATGDGARMAALSDGVVAVDEMEAHSLWGSVGVWALAGTALLRTLWRHRSERLFLLVNLLLVVGVAALTVTITILGAAIRHG